MPEILLEVNELTKNYPDPASVFSNKLLKRRAVDCVSLSIKKGETLAVVGESGCGKTTLGHMIMNLLPVTSGSVIYKNRDITNAKDPPRKDMQAVFQDPYAALNPWMTIYNLLAEPIIIHKLCDKKEIPECVNELLRMVGLSQIGHNRYPHQLSGGQRQRLCVARAVAVHPEFIICDEPVSALDVSIQSQILNLLTDLRENLDLTYLFISHNLAVVRSIADSVAVMYLGRIIEKAPADAFFAEPMHPYSKALIAAAPEPVISKKKKRPVITGEALISETPEGGCAYYPRCTLRKNTCASNIPQLKEISPGRSAACFCG